MTVGGGCLMSFWFGLGSTRVLVDDERWPSGKINLNKWELVGTNFPNPSWSISEREKGY